MFATPAYAQAAGGAMGAVTSLMPLILIFAIMYFLLIRPQQKKLKEHKAMVEALRRGDQVLTQGGIVGKVVKVCRRRDHRGGDRRGCEGQGDQAHDCASDVEDRTGSGLKRRKP